MKAAENGKQVQIRLCDGATTTASLHISAFGYLKSSPTCPSHFPAQSSQTIHRTTGSLLNRACPTNPEQLSGYRLLVQLSRHDFVRNLPSYMVYAHIDPLPTMDLETRGGYSPDPVGVGKN